MTTQERIYYFRGIDQWFRDNVEILHGSLTRGMDRIRTFDQVAGFLADGIGDEITQNLAQIEQSIEEEWVTLPIVDEPDPMMFAGPLQLLDTDQYFLMPGNLRLQPSPPEPGLGWGPFGWVSKWLLRTKSIALALISGMLGFGLLGAAISSTVRARPKAADGTEEPVRADIGRVIVKGITAAVVIFLAVMGGLAIFAADSQEPNAYVLFFTCLVGAVFSEDVWAWARKRMQQNLSQGTAGRSASPNGSGG
jgi:hypothetical protein